MLCLRVALFTNVILIISPTFALITGPGMLPLYTQAVKNSPGAYSMFFSSTVIVYSLVTPVATTDWAGAGSRKTMLANIATAVTNAKPVFIIFILFSPSY